MNITELNIIHDVKQILNKHIKKIRVNMNQICYIVTPIHLLSLFFDIEFYYIIDGLTYYNEINKIEFNKYNLITENNIFYVLSKDFCKMVMDDYITYDNSILYYKTSDYNVFFNLINYDMIHKISFTVEHGVDEESYVLRKVWTENIKDYTLYKAISNANISNNLVDTIYKIDKTKKTILFQDSISSSFFSPFCNDSIKLIEFQTRLANDLIKLKDKYNIIIRFHPQTYNGYYLNEPCVADIILQNFIIDFTQISLLDLHNYVDIIVSARYTSSGYQSLFLLNKNMIIIDMDLDVRKTCGFAKYWLVTDRTNQDITNMMDNDEILNNKLVVIGQENSISIYDEVEKIENNNFEINNEIIKKRIDFINDKFKFKENEMFDDYDKIYFILFILEQIKDDIFTKLIEQILSYVSKQSDHCVNKYNTINDMFFNTL